MIAKIKGFLSEVKIETKKATYPPKDELIGSTKVVITAVIIVSFFLGIVDFAVSNLIRQLIG